MQEIKVNHNNLGVSIYLENTPDIFAIPECELNLLVSELELFIYDRVICNQKRKKKADNRPP